jgi:integrase
MEDYICDLFCVYYGRNRQLAVNSVYGLYMQLPPITGQLKASEQLLKGWKAFKPSVSHPPLTWPLVVLIARTMAANGHVDCAIAVLVSFDGLLRVGEMAGIRVAAVSVPGDWRRGGSGPLPSHTASMLAPIILSGRVYIRLAKTKTGDNQTAELYNAQVGMLLAQLIQNRSSDDFAFSFPTADRTGHFRRVLHSACQSLHIDTFHFSPHSLRHGGATHANMHMGQSVEQVMHRGRWVSNNMCRTYIQSGKAALLTQQLPTGVQQLAQQILPDWFQCLWEDCFPSPQC